MKYIFTILFACSLLINSAQESGQKLIDLINFSGKVEDDLVILNWSTISEANHQVFTVEISKDCINFSPESTINASQVKNYEYTDIPRQEGALYYRIKQTDGNNHQYSKIVAVQYKKTKGFNIFPNPGNGNFNLNYSLNGYEIGELSLYNAAGQKISTYELNYESNRLSIDNANLAKGIYFAFCNVNGQLVYKEKLVVN